MGDLRCLQCSRTFHDACARRAGCLFVDGSLDNIRCDVCANSDVLGGLSDASVASRGTNQLPSTSGYPDGASALPVLPDPIQLDSGTSSRASSPPGNDTSQDSGTTREVQKLSEWLKKLMQETKDSILRTNQSLVETNTSLRSLENKLTGYDTRISANTENISDIKTQLENLAVQFGSSSLVSSSGTLSQSGTSVEVVASELQDRLRRASNIMLYNLPTSNDGSDLVRVKAALSRIDNLNLDNISVRRFSKSTRMNAPPPVLLRMSSTEEASRILRNWKLLPTGLNVSADRTTAQRNLYKKLKDEATVYNRAHPSGNKKFIKYVNGTPILAEGKN